MDRQQRANLLKEKRRQAIIDTALRLFYENGIEKVKVDHIAKELNISHGLFYHYFKDKDALVEAIKEASKDMFVEDARNWGIEHHTGYSFFKQFTETLLDCIATDIKKLYVINFLLFCNYKELSKKSDVGSIFDHIIELIKKEQEKGVFEDSISYQDLLITYISTFQGLATARIKNRNNYGLPSVDAIMQIFLKKAK